MTAVNPPHRDPALLAFLTERLAEEREAAAQRGTTAGPVDTERTERGLRMLEELVHDLEQGRTPDPMTLGLLTVAYAGRPDFRKEWNRWAD